MKRFLENSHPDTVCFAKLGEEFGEVAVEHLFLLRLDEDPNGNPLKPNIYRKGQKRLAAELKNIEDVARLWRERIESEVKAA